MSPYGPPEAGARAPGRRPAAPTRAHRCSCELLLELCGREPVRSIVTEFGVRPDRLARVQAELHAEIASEPADWRLRLSQRGRGQGDQGEIEAILAIVRTAESHAYQLLERSGIACAQLRRRLIERMRDLGPVSVQPSARPTRRSQSVALPELLEDAEPSEPPSRPLRASTRLALARGPEREVDDDALDPADLAEPAHPTDPAEIPRRDRANSRVAEGSLLGARPRPRTGDAPDAGRGATTPRTRASGATRGDRDSADADADADADASRRTAAAPAPDPRRRPALAPIDPATLAPLHGHDALLGRLADALGRRAPRPPLLVGPSGSGRTLIATHLARALAQPVFLLRAPSYDGESELRADLAAIAKKSGVAILDDLDRILADAPPDLLTALGQAWSAARPPILTITSPEGRARLQTWMPGLSASLDVIEVPPLTGDDVHLAVRAGAPAILAEHGLALHRDAHLGELCRLADAFLGGALAMPGRALDLLDLSGARTLREGQDEIRRETWVDIVCERSGLPRDRVIGGGAQELLDLEAEVGRRVVGHEGVIQTLAQLIRRNRAGFASGRPIASALLLGPSGVGKTEIAKAFAAALFDREDALVRLDMSEYAEPHAVARIVGAPPGYIGHEQGGALTDPLLRRPHCVVLLDEIEKAHRDVHQLLLQVFDEGRLTDGRGRTIDFRHTLIVMTSNLGSEHLTRKGREVRLDEAKALAGARSAFPVELWNRIEAPLCLHPLNHTARLKICHRLARASSERLFAERGIRYHLGDDACALLIERCGDDAALGARPLRHLLARMVEPLIADAVLRGRVRAGAALEIVVEDGALAIGRSKLLR